MRGAKISLKVCATKTTFCSLSRRQLKRKQSVFASRDAYFHLTFLEKTLRVDTQHSLSPGMIFGVRNRIDTGVITYESSRKTYLTVIFLELCEARKKLKKIKHKKNLHFFLLAIAGPVLGLIKKASLNGCFWTSFLR